MAKLLFDPSQHPDVTFDDVFMVPNNPLAQRVREKCSEEECSRLTALEEAYKLAGGTDREHEVYAAYRTELLNTAERLGVGKSASRDHVDLTPRGQLSNTPLVVSNMNNVAGKRMAEAIARVGGIAAIPQDKKDQEVLGIIEYMRTRHPVYETPVTISPETKIHEFRRVMNKRSHSAAIVTDEESRMIGLLSHSDIPDGINEDASIEPHFRRETVVTAKDEITPMGALNRMEESHVHYLPVLDDDSRVTGALTKIDAAMRLRYAPNIDPVNGGLRALYTVGALNKNPLDRVKLLMDNGIRDILLDTAHFDQGIQPYRNIEKIRNLAEQQNLKLNIMAGNVVTREAVRDILIAGAQFVKVGIGPGAMCTTRMQTGVGRPQVSAVLEAAEEAAKHNGYVVADGGIAHPRDAAIAIAAGADYVMFGTLWAGTHESPSTLNNDERGQYKINYGMASTRASVLRTLGRESRTPNDIFRDAVGHRSEGISESRVYLKKGLESVALLHHHILDGVASSAAYAGARSVQEFPHLAIMGLQTRSGFAEGTAKDKF